MDQEGSLLKKKVIIFFIKYVLFLIFVTGIGAFAYFMGYGQSSEEESVETAKPSDQKTVIPDSLSSASEEDHKSKNEPLGPLTDLKETQSSPPGSNQDEYNDEEKNIEEDKIEVSFDIAGYDIDDETYQLYVQMLYEAGPLADDIDFLGTICEYDGAGIRLEGIIRNGTDYEFINQHIQLHVYAKKQTDEEFLLADNEFILLEETFGVLEPGDARYFSVRFGPNRVSNTIPDWSKGFRVEVSLIE